MTDHLKLIFFVVKKNCSTLSLLVSFIKNLLSPFLYYCIWHVNISYGQVVTGSDNVRNAGWLPSILLWWPNNHMQKGSIFNWLNDSSLKWSRNILASLFYLKVASLSRWWLITTVIISLPLLSITVLFEALQVMFPRVSVQTFFFVDTKFTMLSDCSLEKPFKISRRSPFDTWGQGSNLQIDVRCWS